VGQIEVCIGRTKGLEEERNQGAKQLDLFERSGEQAVDCNPAAGRGDGRGAGAISGVGIASLRALR
jgi:hypothetical protein